MSSSTIRTIACGLPLCILAVTGLALVLGGRQGSAAPAPTASGDTAMVVLRHFSSGNRGDGSAALSDFAPGAIIVGGFSCFPTPCTTRPAIQAEIDTVVAQHANFTLLSLNAEGAVAQGRLELRADAVSAAGVERIMVIYTIVVADDHIVLISALPDPTDAQTAAFLAARAH